MVDDYLLKPINPSTLFDVINNLLHLTPTRSLQEVNQLVDLAEIRDILKDSKVLLVEDNEMNLDLATELLEDVGIQLKIAMNGLQALEALEHETFDAVLMDIQMPEMDGLTATMRIRQQDKFKDLPILAMTAHAMKGEAEKSIAAGMNEHITKPIDPLVLYSALIKHIRKRSVAVSTPAVSSAPFQIHGIDTAEGLYRVGNKLPAYIKLLKSYCAVYGNILQEGNRLLASPDIHELKTFLHTLTGITGNIGAKEIHAQLAPLYAHIQGQDKSITQLSPEEVSCIKEIFGLIAQLIQQIEITLSKESEQQAQRQPIDLESLGQHWNQMLSSIRDNDSSALDIAEMLLARYELSAEHEYRLKRAVKFLETFEFEEAERALSL